MTQPASQDTAPIGPPFAYYAGPPTDTIDIEAGFPVASVCAASGDVVPSQLPGGRIATLTHVGPYESTMATYDQPRAWVGDQGLELQHGMWEVYLSDPQKEPDPSRWRTLIFWPVAPAAVRASGAD